eukprot:1160690-Pelagomonas_calceolata.AAC.7
MRRRAQTCAALISMCSTGKPYSFNPSPGASLSTCLFKSNPKTPPKCCLKCKYSLSEAEVMNMQGRYTKTRHVAMICKWKEQGTYMLRWRVSLAQTPEGQLLPQKRMAGGGHRACHCPGQRSRGLLQFAK